MKHSYSWPDYVVTLRVNPITRTYTIVNDIYYPCVVNENGKKVVADKDNSRNDIGGNCKEVIDCKVNLATLAEDLSFVDEVSAIESGDQLPLSDVELKNTRVIFTVGENCPVADVDSVNQSADRFCEEIKPVIENIGEIDSSNDESNHLISEIRRRFSCANNDPPIITIVDYDSPSTSKSWINAQHACIKCKSENYLKLQVDPFRASIEKAVKKFDNDQGHNKNNRIVERRFRSRSATYELPPNINKIFGRRTKSFADPKFGGKKNEAAPYPSGGAANHKKEVLLKGHYYPEGGWGFIIVTCSALVHLLGVGLQLSVPGTVYISAQLKFNHPPLHSSGKINKNKINNNREKLFVEIFFHCNCNYNFV